MDINKEKVLVESLKLNYNKTSKSEINLQKSSQIFHKLGLLYKKRRYNKICLIQSAALLEAARIRSCDNKQKMQNDLESVWHLVLHKAKAKNNYTALQTQTKFIANKVQRMRIKIEQMSKEIPQVGKSVIYNTKVDEITKRKINMVKLIQERITTDYLSVMECLARRCIEILGKPSCKFALVGMGSLARKEITPYSDFECIIVLEEGVQKTKNYQHSLEYFRWFSVIFQIVLISLGETILPSVAIPSLNNFHQNGGDWFYDDVAPNGISFDGFMPHACKTPLGRQQPTKTKPWKTELIKPVSEMLKYLSSEEDLKNGYHLADILTQTCYVFGDTKVFAEFEKEITSKLEQHQQSNEAQYFDQLNCQVANDKNKFDLESFIQRLLVFNLISVKSAFYRSITVFISALGKFHQLKSKSSFDIVDDLKQAEVFSETDANKLKYAIAIGCEARLKVYQTFKKQKDQIDGDLKSDEAANCVVEAVGKKSIYDYCLIAQSMQENLPLFEAKTRNVNIKLCQKTNGHHFEKVFFNKLLLRFLFWATFLVNKRWILAINIIVLLVCWLDCEKDNTAGYYAYIPFYLMFVILCDFFHRSFFIFFSDSNNFQPLFLLAHRNFYCNFFSVVATSKKLIKEIFKKCDKNHARKLLYVFRMTFFYVKVLGIWLVFCLQIYQSCFIIIAMYIIMNFEIPWYCFPFTYDHMSPIKLIIDLSNTFLVIFCAVFLFVSTSLFQYNACYRNSIKNFVVVIVLTIFLFWSVLHFIFSAWMIVSFLVLVYVTCTLISIKCIGKVVMIGFIMLELSLDLCKNTVPYCPYVLGVTMRCILKCWMCFLTYTAHVVTSISTAVLPISNLTSSFLDSCPNTSLRFYECDTLARCQDI